VFSRVHLLLFLLLLLPGVLLLLPLLPKVHLLPVVLLVLQVFLLPGALPLLLLLEVHLLSVVPLPVTRELLPIMHPLAMTIVTATVTTVIILVHLYAVACMVALGALAGLGVVALLGVLWELLGKEMGLGVWVLVWEMEVVARKVMREVSRESMIPGMGVQEGVVAVVHQQKKKDTPGRTPCSLCVWRSRRIERKLAFWVCGLLFGAWGQGSMPPRRTRRNQGLRRYPTQKGSPDAKRFSGRNPMG